MLSGLVIGLSVAFGCFVVALVAELCYLLWWKKRRTHTETEEDHGNDAKRLLYGVCWKAPSTTNSVSVRSSDPEDKGHEPDLELGKDVVGLKNFGEEGVECELMRLHNLAGPPRFLFTIKEESKEDLDSEDGRSRKGSRTRSLSDLIVATIDTPFLNPMASSPLRCSLDGLDSFKHQGFNPLFESSVESELSRFRSNSPPPKFKFLRDAEEKLLRRLVEEAQRKAKTNHVSVPESEAKDSPNSTSVTDNSNRSLLRFVNSKEREQVKLQQHLPYFSSSSSQVLPLASSPTTFKPVEKASMVH